MSTDEAKSRMKRILSLLAEIDDLKADIREVYGEEKAAGGDKTAMGAAISIIRKREKDAAGFEERNAIVDLYLSAFDGSSHVRAYARTREAEPNTSPEPLTAAQSEGFDEGRGDLTADRLREVLSYDPESGEFHWLQLPPMALRAKVGDRAGRVQNHGYRTIRIAGKDHVEHRLAWLYIFGEWPEGHLDHINGDKADNRIMNIREATASQNMANRPVSARNRSGHKGVSWAAGRQAWMASIRVEGHCKFLGYFDSKELAATAYEAAAEEAHGEFAVHNRPDEPAPAADVRPIFGGREPKPLRPNCKSPENCAGYGSKHCFRCAQASGEAA